MATNMEFMEYVHEQSGLGNALSYRKMFGEYALYLDGKVVALACDNSLFLKPVPATYELTRSFPKAPPYPGAKLYCLIDEVLDDTDRLRALLLSTAAALPLPKPKNKTTHKSRQKPSA